LQLQIELCESGVLDERAQADSQSYCMVMATYARSKDARKVHHTYRLLQKLLKDIAEERVSNGDSIIVCFTTVLNAAAYVRPPRGNRNAVNSSNETQQRKDSDSNGAFGHTIEAEDEVYTIALQAYREMKEDVYRLNCKPDHMAFAAMLRVIGVHTDVSSVERRQMVQLVFEDACAAGHVSKLVIKNLWEACPDAEMLASLLQSQELAESSIDTINQLPRHWTRNVSAPFRSLKHRGKRGSFNLGSNNKVTT